MRDDTRKVVLTPLLLPWSSLSCEEHDSESIFTRWLPAGNSKMHFLLIPLIDCRGEVWANEGCSLVSHAVCCSGELWSHAWSCSRGRRVVRVAKKVKVGRAGVRRDPDWPVTSCSPSHWSLVDALSMPILEPSDALPVRGSGYSAECEL